MENTFDKIILQSNKTKIPIILGMLIVPVLAIKLIFANSSIDPFILYTILALGFVLAIVTLQYSFKITLVSYLLLQLIIISIFLDNKLTALIGTNFKLYAIAFGLAFFTFIYYIFKNFKYLWANSLPFRLLFIFFLLNIPYFLFYHSDFRVWYSDYMDIWLSRPEIRLLFLKQGIDVFSKSFEETKVIGMYLGSLVPVVCFTVSFMVFSSIDSIKDYNERFFKIIKIFSFSFVVYFALAVLFIILGVSTIGFFGGRLWGDFLGFGHSFAVYLSYYLILLLCFRFYIANTNETIYKTVFKYTITILPVICATLVLLQINKTALIALTIALLIFFILCIFTGIKFRFNHIKNFTRVSIKSIFHKRISIIIVSIIILFAAMLFSNNLEEAIITTISRLEMRFSSISTFNIRTILWLYFCEYWYENLSMFKLFFGYGIDSSRETAFYLSSILAGDIKLYTSPLVHVHNYYLELFFDYGFVSFIYFAAIITIGINNIKELFNSANNKILKLLCITSLSIISFFAIFSLTEILRIPIAIIFFSSLGFIESGKRCIKRFGDINVANTQ